MPRRRARLIVAATALAVVASATGCSAATTPPPEPHDSRDVGIQLFQYTWNAIADECERSLGPIGIDWVLTSPPQEHIVGEPWWTAYQPVSYRVESRLGSREEFAAMTKTCREAGVDIIADAVINHMTGLGTAGTGWAGSEFEHHRYPGIWEPDDFHYCEESSTGSIVDYRDAGEVQNCRLLNLADLATERTDVQDRIRSYLEDLLSLGVAGFRIDAAKHMPAADIAAIVDGLPDDTRILQEVIRGSGEPITPEQYADNGLVWEFGFARDVKFMIENGLLGTGDKFGPDFATLPSEVAVSFVDNHDTERNGETLSYRDGDAYALALAFLLAQPYGSPQLYSGYAFESTDAGPPQSDDGEVTDADCESAATAIQSSYRPGDWVCAQRWDLVRAMLEFRSAVGDEPLVDLQENGKVAAFGRGSHGFVVLNGSTLAHEGEWRTSLAPGDYTDVVGGGTVTVRGDGTISASVPGHGVLAIHVGALAD